MDQGLGMRSFIENVPFLGYYQQKIFSLSEITRGFAGAGIYM